MFTDSHCHLTMIDLALYHGDFSQVIAQAKQAQVHRMMTISVALDDHKALAEIAAQYPEVGYSVGVHPCEPLDQLQRVNTEILVDLAQPSKVWAIGETGLDYYHNCDDIEAQKRSFIHHIHASQRVKKPLVVHTRQAQADTIAILTAEKVEHGILHCFTEDWHMAKQALDLGLYISFSGIISFKNAQSLRDVVAKMPLDRILIETDSPYLAPVPYRGKGNEPKYVPYVAQVIAQIHQRTVEDIAQITNDNFDRLLQQYH